MHVEVTDADIYLGVPGDNAMCPVAHAVCRAFGLPPGSARVDMAQIQLPGLDPVDTPEAVAFWVDDFDHGVPSFPFSFDL
jgi:hypothetical protein